MISALNDIHSPRITIAMLETSLQQLSDYYTRYRDRLASASHSFIIHLQTVIRAILSHLQQSSTSSLSSSSSSSSSTTTILSTDGYLRELRIENVNLFELLRFVSTKRIVYKLNGFIDRQVKNKKDQEKTTSSSSLDHPPTSYFPAVIEFIRALTTDNSSSRIIVHQAKDYTESYVQLLLLNPASEFQTIIDSAHSVVITGGTLRPVGNSIE